MCMFVFASRRVHLACKRREPDFEALSCLLAMPNHAGELELDSTRQKAWKEALEIAEAMVMAARN